MWMSVYVCVQQYTSVDIHQTDKLRHHIQIEHKNYSNNHTELFSMQMDFKFIISANTKPKEEQNIKRTTITIKQIQKSNTNHLE